MCWGKKRCRCREVTINGGLSAVLYLDFYFSYYYAQESWDYIGSSRMVYDMDSGTFPSDPWKVKNKSNYSGLLLIWSPKGHENLAILTG